jgi:hypothetical protein
MTGELVRQSDFEPFDRGKRPISGVNLLRGRLVKPFERKVELFEGMKILNFSTAEKGRSQESTF